MKKRTVERVTRGACFTAITLAAALLLGVTAAAAGPADPRKTCDLSGTWYGGSNPYIAWQLTISRTTEGSYGWSALQSLKWADFGVYSATGFSGRIEKSGRSYNAYGMGMYRLTEDTAASIPADPGLPEVDVVSGRVQTPDCDTLKFTWNVYFVYYNFDTIEGDRVPFVAPPDLDIIALVGGPLEETFHRLPSPGPMCESSSNAVRISSPDALEPRASRVPARR